MAELDGPPHDLPRLIEVLDRHGVEYLIVGGAAALPTVASGRPKMPTAWCAGIGSTSTGLPRLSANCTRVSAWAG